MTRAPTRDKEEDGGRERLKGSLSSAVQSLGLPRAALHFLGAEEKCGPPSPALLSHPLFQHITHRHVRVWKLQA